MGEQTKTDDLFHTCIEYALSPEHRKKFNEAVDKKYIRYLFVRMFLNNYRSKTSQYYKLFIKDKDNIEYLPNLNIEIAETVNEELQDKLYTYLIDILTNRTPLNIHVPSRVKPYKDSFVKPLYLMYLSEGHNFKTLSEKTQISPRTISLVITATTEKLKQLISEYKQTIIK